jgi:hypothetical protein
MSRTNFVREQRKTMKGKHTLENTLDHQCDCKNVA